MGEVMAVMVFSACFTVGVTLLVKHGLEAVLGVDLTWGARLILVGMWVVAILKGMVLQKNWK